MYVCERVNEGGRLSGITVTYFLRRGNSCVAPSARGIILIQKERGNMPPLPLRPELRGLYDMQQTCSPQPRVTLSTLSVTHILFSSPHSTRGDTGLCPPARVSLFTEALPCRKHSLPGHLRVTSISRWPPARGASHCVPLPSVPGNGHTRDSPLSRLWP